MTTTTRTFASDPIVLPPSLAPVFEKNIGKLNVLPAIAMDALKMSKDPNCSMSEFSKLIERDIKLATDILRMANCVVYSNGSPIQSLHQAVVRLGFRQCKNLILSSSVSGLMKKISLQESWVRELLWRHSFLTGMLSLHLNRIFNAGFFGEEFTAGLVHDFGRTIFAFCLPNEFGRIDPLQFNESEQTLEHEQNEIGIDHCQVGTWFAMNNQLPEPIADVIRYHHTPNHATNSSRLVALVAIADQIANALQRSDNLAQFDPDSIPYLDTLEATGVSRVKQHFVENYTSVINYALQDAAAMLQD